jgi:hypothetical protein
MMTEKMNHTHVNVNAMSWIRKDTATYQVRVKFTLEQATKTHRGSRVITTLSLTSALEGEGWSTPRPGRLTPGKDMVPIV